MAMLTEKEKIILEPFSLEHLQIAAPIIATLHSSGIDYQKFKTIYEEYQRELLHTKQSTNAVVAKKQPVCPKCGSPVQISRVNISRCTRVGGNYKIAITCIDKDCMHTTYK